MDGVWVLALAGVGITGAGTIGVGTIRFGVLAGAVDGMDGLDPGMVAGDGEAVGIAHLMITEVFM